MYLFVLFILERGREGERKEEKYQCAVASGVPPTGNLAHNPAMCPDWESNRQPFGLQADTQSTQSHQPGHVFLYISNEQHKNEIKKISFTVSSKNI